MDNKYLKFIPKLSLKLKWKTGTVFCALGEIDRSNKSPELMDGWIEDCLKLDRCFWLLECMDMDLDIHYGMNCKYRISLKVLWEK